MAAGIPMGYGAIMKLTDSGNCGKGSRSPNALRMVGVWKAMSALFTLDKVTVTEGSRTETYNTIKAAEKPDCSGSDEGPFPKGIFGKFPIYLVPTYKDEGGKVVGAKSGRCFATSVPSKELVYVKDAYRRCAIANKP